MYVFGEVDAGFEGGDEGYKLLFYWVILEESRLVVARRCGPGGAWWLR